MSDKRIQLRENIYSLLAAAAEDHGITPAAMVSVLIRTHLGPKEQEEEQPAPAPAPTPAPVAVATGYSATPTTTSALSPEVRNMIDVWNT